MLGTLAITCAFICSALLIQARVIDQRAAADGPTLRVLAPCPVRAPSRTEVDRSLDRIEADLKVIEAMLVPGELQKLEHLEREVRRRSHDDTPSP